MIRAISGPEGAIPSAPASGRWTASRKGRVCAAVVARALSESEAVERYGLSHEELAGWLRAYRAGGVGALKRGERRAAAAAPITQSAKGRFLAFLKRSWRDG